MNWKKFLCGTLAASMIFSASISCSAEESASDKLARIEIDTYGNEQSGALLDRISRLEKSYSGQNMDGNMNARIEAIYDTLYDNSADVGILAKINMLEWNVNHSVADGGIDARLATLENQILGKISEGTFNERIRELSKAIFGEEFLPLSQVQIPVNTLIKVETTAPVSSRVLQEGDTVPIKVIDEIFVDNNLVFAKGLTGEGVIVGVHRAKNIFSNGKIETDFNKLKSLDGQEVKIFTGIESVEAMSNNSMARGLSLVGQTFSGKNKQLEEVLIRGKNVDLPAGIELYVQIKEPVIVYGLRQKGGFGNIQPPVSVIERQSPAPPSIEPTLTEPTEPTETVVFEEEKSSTPKEETRKEEIRPESPKENTPAPPDSTNVEPRPDEGKTLEGFDGEIIEIIDED
ncbi:MAG: hypothetical protein IKZ53_11140 [Selenomonadaceae bacterium]|nr:hypothetical protein [Selenomonadaceae bacterium]